MMEIKLTQGQVALVDDEDFEFLNQWKWCAHKQNDNYYATRISYNIKERTYYKMHRVILGLHEGNTLVVDHINHNGLDNRKENLRICTKAENNRNRYSNKNSTSKYKGVSLEKKKYFSKKKQDVIYYMFWRAEIQIDHKNIYIGNFKNETDAAIAYNIRAKELFGEFAILNEV